jgi:hypothetical protein
MRKEKISLIREQINNEIPEINLRLILEQARIEDVIHKPPFHRFRPLKNILIGSLSLCLVFFASFLIRHNSSRLLEPEDNALYQPVSEIIDLIEANDLNHNYDLSDPVISTITDETEFLNQYFGLVNYYLNNKTINDIVLNIIEYNDYEYSKDYDDRSQFDLEIIQKSRKYNMEGIKVDNKFQIILNSESTTYQLLVEDNYTEIEISDNGNLYSKAQLKLENEIVVLKNMIYQNAIVTYNISKSNSHYLIQRNIDMKDIESEGDITIPLEDFAPIDYIIVNRTSNNYEYKVVSDDNEYYYKSELD